MPQPSVQAKLARQSASALRRPEPYRRRARRRLPDRCQRRSRDNESDLDETPALGSTEEAMIRTMLVVSTALLLTVVSSQSGMAWMRGGGGAAGGFHGAGGGSWQRDAGGAPARSIDSSAPQLASVMSPLGMSIECQLAATARASSANSQGVADA